jgi:hypothetical protein
MPGSLQRQASASLLVLHSQATCYLAACQREVPLTNTAPLLPFFSEAFAHQLRDCMATRALTRFWIVIAIFEIPCIYLGYLGLNWRHFHNFLEEDQMKWAKCASAI